MLWSSPAPALSDLVVLVLSTLLMSRVDGGIVLQKDVQQPGTPCAFDPSLNISECYLFNPDGSSDTTIDPTQDATLFLPASAICSLRSGGSVAESDAAVVCEAGQWKRLELEEPEAPERDRTRRWAWLRKPKKVHRCSLSHCKIAHGTFVSWMHKNHEHCTYHCDPGYELIGCDTIKCQHNNRWSPRKPFCRAKYVRPKPVKPVNPIRRRTVQPTRPSTFQPTRPSTFQPTRPSTFQPTRPSTVQPTRPSTFKPTRSSTVQPTRPSTFQPTRTSTVQTTQPSTAQPTQPPTFQTTQPVTIRPAPPVVCAAGSHSTGNDTCTLCADGYYQEQENMSACIRCPEGKFTYKAGATSVNDCMEHIDVTVV